MIITDTGCHDPELTLPIFHKLDAQLWELKVMRLDQDAKIVTFTTVAAAEKKKLGLKMKQKVKYNVS